MPDRRRPNSSDCVGILIAGLAALMLHCSVLASVNAVTSLTPHAQQSSWRKRWISTSQQSLQAQGLLRRP